MTARTTTRGERNKWGKGFSLVEAVIALGIVSFCVLPIIGLIQIGLTTMERSRNHAAAAVCLNQIAESIRSAILTSSGTYQALGSYKDQLIWKDRAVFYTMSDISLGGLPTTSNAEKLLTAYVQITPATNPSTMGMAFVTVGWPNRAQWNSTNNQWEKAQGYVSSWVVFYTNP